MDMSNEMEKFAMWGLLIGGGLALLYITRNGVEGTARDLTSGLVKGVVGAASGVLQGAYNALPEGAKPTSDKNVIYSGANAVVRTLPGASNDETLGTWLYNITHPNESF